MGVFCRLVQVCSLARRPKVLTPHGFLFQHKSPSLLIVLDIAQAQDKRKFQMAETEGESPAQRQARIRREKREAKITAGGSQRLDKIIGVSGRDPELGQYSPAVLSRRSANDITVKKEAASPGDSPAPGSRQVQGTPPQMPPLANADDPAQAQAQEEYLRSLLQSQEPQQGTGDGPQDEDPMMKMLNSILGGGDPNNPTAGLPFSPTISRKPPDCPPLSRT